MTFRLADRWVWDFWLARDGTAWHLFYLNAPRSLGDPDLRHWNATIGHAVSEDLAHWRDLGRCFGPAPEPAWDDGPTWTGSVIRHDGLWYLFYTGTSGAEANRKQRIGLATSTDLHHWQRHPANPVLDIDPQHYEEYDPALWHDRAWRDPYVVPDPGGSSFRMVFTARVSTGPVEGRGVIAQARSDDLIHWTMMEPATAPGRFGQLEVPQLLDLEGRHYLLFSTAAQHIVPGGGAAAPVSAADVAGTHYYAADRPDGPWRMIDAPYLTGGSDPCLYAGKIVTGPSGKPVFLGFRDAGADGLFVGEISDPIPVRVAADGRLSLEEATGAIGRSKAV